MRDPLNELSARIEERLGGPVQVAKAHANHLRDAAVILDELEHGRSPGASQQVYATLAASLNRVGDLLDRMPEADIS